ncbi:hypothetical protein [Helicobacter pylori]|uniref:Lipoprotein n=1 Tax=Helicobacter pylori TaxID=210 RepID=A0AB74KNP7_HELPX|nr:hypothetical protein [Helicobacter pylori]TLR85541.1 hypothetical protein EGM89_03845 [Helicobacter pylori]TLR90782.1 hypothetical protein EGM90_03370 [Helicobacter pylori]
MRTKLSPNISLGSPIALAVGCFTINIKEFTQDTSDNFLKRFFRGFNGVKGGVILKSPYPL